MAVCIVEKTLCLSVAFPAALQKLWYTHLVKKGKVNALSVYRHVMEMLLSEQLPLVSQIL